MIKKILMLSIGLFGLTSIGNAAPIQVPPIFPHGVPTSPLPPVHLVRTMSLPTSLVLNEIRGAMRGLRIHLNNHGPKHPDSRHKRSWQNNNSFIRLRGDFYPLDLQEMSKKVGRRHYYYYVDNINLRNFSVSTEGRFIRIVFRFEDNGPEVKGYCLIKRAFHWRSCPIGEDKAAPDIHFTHPTLVALIQPVAFHDSISFGTIDVRYTGGVRVNGIGRPFSSMATRIMRSAVHNGLTEELLRGGLQQLIADRIRSRLDALHVGRIVSVRLNGRNFDVGVRS